MGREWTPVNCSTHVLRQLRQIRRSVSIDTFTTLVASLVPTRLDYGNSVLAELPVYLVVDSSTVGAERSCATDVHVRTICVDQTTSLTRFVCLYWLSVPEWVQCKIAVLGYKVLHGLAPAYLGPLNHVADLPGRRSLRSAVSSRLAVPLIIGEVDNRRQSGFSRCRSTDLESTSISNLFQIYIKNARHYSQEDMCIIGKEEEEEDLPDDVTSAESLSTFR